MTFGAVPIDDAVDCILAHTHRPAEGRPIRKGTRLSADDVQALRQAGITEVIVARLHPADVGEDEAAARLAATVAGGGIEVRSARTGRSNLHATHRGVLVLDEATVHAVNAVDPAITLGTLPPFARVEARDMVATVKIIPFAVPEGSVVGACAAVAAPALRVAPFRRKRVALITSQLPGLPQRLVLATQQAQEQRVLSLDGEVLLRREIPHAVPDARRALIDACEAGAQVVLFMGASAIVDPADVLPSALLAAGGRVTRLGMPVDPGNLALVGELHDTVVLGVPGCARSLKRNGFDHLLEHVTADLPITSAAVAALGVGGLLAETTGRPHPRQGPPTRSPRLGAVVLAAGASSRMGPTNKLLAQLDGRPLVTWAVDAMLAGGADPVVVVVGHHEAEIRSALTDRAVQIVVNPTPEAGMGTSLATGVGAMPEDLDGWFVMLGDVPFVRASDLAALTAAFNPTAGAAICMPEHAKRRGHPVLWAARYRGQLAALRGDTGAKAILDAHTADVCVVPVDNPGIHQDVDTPEALRDARQRTGTD
ncbi:MAG: molybdopterin-binding/glycosyltransferase family 2 protein [Myxococcales bacterium]|nr:molybdopterin-binding/glycosyltransferase family 2 protein [Myxococcales bacterium]